jgi:hypothetical protein
MERFDPLAAQSSDLSGPGWALGEIGFAGGSDETPIGDLVRAIVARLERETDRRAVEA